MSDPLALSVSSLQSSLQLLDSSINTLDAGVNDFPRLTKVLQTTRHYELLPEPHLHDAQTTLCSEITPSITHLLRLAENYVEKLKRREESLRAKSELQEGRIEWGRRSSGPDRSSMAKGGGRNSGLAGRVGGGGNGGSGEKVAELQRLQQKKERLRYAVERLELQSRQRQRELRRSVVGNKIV